MVVAVRAIATGVTSAAAVTQVAAGSIRPEYPEHRSTTGPGDPGQCAGQRGAGVRATNPFDPPDPAWTGGSTWQSGSGAGSPGFPQSDMTRAVTLAA